MGARVELMESSCGELWARVVADSGVQASSKPNKSRWVVSTWSTACTKPHRVIDLHRPESDSEGLNAGAPRVERAIYREKEALPAGQRQ